MTSELIKDAITEHYGEKCLDFEKGCQCCDAWVEYDRLTRAVPDVPELVRYSAVKRYGREEVVERDEHGEYVRHDQAAAMIADARKKSVANGMALCRMRNRAEAAEAELATRDAEIERLENSNAHWINENRQNLKNGQEAAAKLAEHVAARQSYANLFNGDVGSIHENIRTLKAKLAQINDQKPVAVIQFDRSEGHENEMPKVISCDWFMDGRYQVYLAPVSSEAETIERCASVAELHDGQPCGTAIAWSEEECQFYNSGQQDAAASIAAAIRALSGKEPS